MQHLRYLLDGVCLQLCLTSFALAEGVSYQSTRRWASRTAAICSLSWDNRGWPGRCWLVMGQPPRDHVVCEDNRIWGGCCRKDRGAAGRAETPGDAGLAAA